MATTVADGLWRMLISAGVSPCYGVVGDAPESGDGRVATQRRHRLRPCSQRGVRRVRGRGRSAPDRAACRGLWYGGARCRPSDQRPAGRPRGAGAHHRAGRRHGDGSAGLQHCRRAQPVPVLRRRRRVCRPTGQSAAVAPRGHFGRCRCTDRGWAGRHRPAWRCRGRTGTDFVNPDFAKVADAMGARGIRLEDPADVPDALQDALAHKGGPVVPDAVVDPYALALPGHVPAATALGFTLGMARQVLAGHLDEVRDRPAQRQAALTGRSRR